MSTFRENMNRLGNYILEREQIRQRKERGEKFPWTTDTILQTYKFTNVLRENDRTTRKFKEIYATKVRDVTRDTQLYWAALFRYFGTYEWAKEIGLPILHDSRHIAIAVHALQKSGVKVFTGAYMITNANRAGPKEIVVASFLKGLWASRHSITDEMVACHSWRVGHEKMRKLDGFGGTGFMAKEVLQDWLMMYPDENIQDRDTWTPVGPGARRGLLRMYGQFEEPRRNDRLEKPKVRIRHSKEGYGCKKLSEDDMLKQILEIREELNVVWKEGFPRERRLTAHDVQFVLCEYDKYERARLGQGRPRSLYKPRERGDFPVHK